MTALLKLDGCVAGLGACVASLEDSIDVFDAALADHDRLGVVLSSRRIFGLVPDRDLRDAKACFRAVVAPRVQLVLLAVDNAARASGIEASADRALQYARLSALQGERARLASEIRLAKQEDNVEPYMD